MAYPLKKLQQHLEMNYLLQLIIHYTVKMKIDSFLLGQSKTIKTLVVIHIEKRESIRIVSARKATKKEQKIYEEV